MTALPSLTEKLEATPVLFAARRTLQSVIRPNVTLWKSYVLRQRVRIVQAYLNQEEAIIHYLLSVLGRRVSIAEWRIEDGRLTIVLPQLDKELVDNIKSTKGWIYTIPVASEKRHGWCVNMLGDIIATGVKQPMSSERFEITEVLKGVDIIVRSASGESRTTVF